MLLRLMLLALILLPITTTEVYAIHGGKTSDADAAPATAPTPAVVPTAPAASNNAPATPPASQPTTPTGTAIPDQPSAAKSYTTDQSYNSDDYVDLTWPNLARTMVHFNVLNLNDPVVIDEYSIITECDLYKAYYQDDFKWDAVRRAVRDSIKMNSASYPVKYRYPINMQLDRYDFAAKVFRFTHNSTLNNVNTFKLFTAARRTCGAASVRTLPHDFRVVLAAPVFLDGLPFSDKEAQTVLRRMEDDQDPDRILYAVFNIRVLYIEPLRKISQGVGVDTTVKYLQAGDSGRGPGDIRIDARLDSIDFYTDAAMKHQIYKYAP